MDDKPKRVRKPGPRSKWCPRCRRIKPKGKPRGGSWTPEEAKAWAIAREAYKRRQREGKAIDMTDTEISTPSPDSRPRSGAPSVCPECGAPKGHMPDCSLYEDRPLDKVVSPPPTSANSIQRDPETEAEIEVPDWATPLDMIRDEFPDLMAESWWSWRVVLKVINALPLDDRELAFAQEHTGRTTMPSEPVRRIYVGAGRRGGKSLMDAVQAVFHATKKRTWTLAPGETSTIPIIAADRTQATTIYGYVKGLLQASPTLAPLIVGQPTKDRITLSNRTVIRIFTASYKTTRGYSLAAAVGDEVAFWESSETSTNPDKEIVNAIRPGLLTTRGPLIITSTPYARRGVLWEGFKSYFGNDDASGVYWKASSLAMNPSLDPAEIEEAYAEDPEAAAAEFGGEFRSDLAAFISEELIASVTIPGRGDLPYVAKYKYHAFVDPSGGSTGGDAYTLAIGHTEGTTHIVDCVREITPPFSTEGVTATYAEVMAMYKIRECHGDHYAAEWPVQMFRDHGSITYHKSEFPKSDLYLQTLPLITSGKVELPEHKRLIGQLRSLERRTSRAGKDSIDHPPRGKDDVSNAVAGLLALLARKRRAWGHLGVFGYSNDGTTTKLIGDTASPQQDEPRWEDRVCPACGRSITGYLSYEAPEILKEMTEHWVKYRATKAHVGKTPPITIEELVYER
jgi:hypothetical protein